MRHGSPQCALATQWRRRFVYVDSLCGITFNVEAWAKRRQFFQIIHAVVTLADVALRYDIFAKYGKRLAETL